MPEISSKEEKISQENDYSITYYYTNISLKHQVHILKNISWYKYYMLQIIYYKCSLDFM